MHFVGVFSWGSLVMVVVVVLALIRVVEVGVATKVVDVVEASICS